MLFALLYNKPRFFGMGVDAADFNNDGWVDLFQLDMNAADNFRSKANMSSMNPEVFYQSVALGLHHQYMQNSLQLNQGNLEGEIPSFSNIARWGDVSSTDWSWGALMADFDNDGWKDIFITNGIRRDVNNKDFYNEHRAFFDKMENDPTYKNKEEEVKLLNYLEEIPSEKLSNYLFHNLQEKGFENKSEAWGLGEKSFSNGVAYSDLDNDGDLDLIINNLEDRASIYENNTSVNNYITLSLYGKNNQMPMGAKIHCYVKDNYQFQEYNLSRGYMSSVSPKIHFGLAENTQIDRLVIEWPDGKETELKNLKSNQHLTINYEKESELSTTSKNKTLSKKFETLVQQNPFIHRENPYDDFKEEILLPHKNSTLGPALAVGDLNGDDREDYVVGGAIGQPAAIYVQQKNGNFQKIDVPVFEKDKFYEDLGIALIDAENDGDLDLYFASGGNEFNEGSQGYEDRFYENVGNLKFKRDEKAIPKTRISGLEVSSHDFDHDGDLDLFVGGRLVAKKYPYPSSSRLLENRSELGAIEFVDVTQEKLPTLKNMGLVTASTWVDLDGDGVKDENEPETTTDKTGAFEFEDDIPEGTDIYVEGGYDLGTGKPNEQKFKLTTSVTGDGSEALVISPVSTQISRAYSKSGVTLAEAQEKVGKAYGLDEAFDNLTNFDPIALAYSSTSNEQAKAALTAQARNIMVSSLGEVSKKVSEYFASAPSPTCLI